MNADAVGQCLTRAPAMSKEAQRVFRIVYRSAWAGEGEFRTG